MPEPRREHGNAAALPLIAQPSGWVRALREIAERDEKYSLYSIEFTYIADELERLDRYRVALEYVRDSLVDPKTGNCDLCVSVNVYGRHLAECPIQVLDD